MADQGAPGQFGRLEIPVEFSTKNLKKSSKVVSEAVRQEGRAIATEMVDALDSEFKLEMARIKEGQARGFVTPAEARKAGMEAAAAYNKGVIQVIDQQSAAGAFRGKEGKQVFTELAGSLKTVETAAGRTGLGLGRLNNTLVTVVQQAVGADPVIGRLFDTTSSFAIGVGAMVPVLAGLAAIAFGITKITEEAREERKALDESTDALKRNAKERQQGPTGDLEDQKAKLAKRIADLKTEIKTNEELLAHQAVAGSTEVEVFAQQRTVEARRKEQVDRQVALIEAEAEIRKIEREEQAKRQKQIQDGIEVANRIEQKGQQEREQIAKEGAAKRQRVVETEATLRARLADLTATAEDDLMLVIDQLESEGKKAAQEAGVAVSKAFVDGIARLRDDARLQAALEPFAERFKDLDNRDPNADSQAALQRFIDDLKKETDALQEGSSARQRYNDLLRRAEELHNRNAKAIENESKKDEKQTAAEAERRRKEELDDLRDRARALEENARAAIQFANAIGAISDETASALENLAQLGAAIVRIAGGDLKAIPSAIGAAAQLAKGIFGNSEKEVQARLKQIDAMASLEKAIRDLEHAVLHDVTDAQRKSIIRDASTLNTKPPDKNGIAEVKNLTVAQAAAFKELERITGIDFFDESTGKINLGLFNQAVQQLQKLDLGTFSKSIAGSIEARHFQDTIAGGRDPQQKLADFLDDVGKFGGGKFGEALRKAIADGGPEAANKMLDDWAQRLASGDQSLFGQGGPFAGLTADEVKDLLTEGNSLLEEWLEKTGGGTTQDFVQARSITEVTASRLLGLDLTRNVLLEQIRDLLAGQMGVDASALSRGTVDGFSAAAHAGLAPWGTSGVPISIHVGTLIDGGITVNAEHGIVDAAAFQAQVAEMVATGLTGAVNRVSQQLADGYRARQRAQGRS